MLKQTTLIASLLLVLCCASILYKVIEHPSNGQRVEEILTQEMEMPQKETKYPTRQMRSGVSKDLWIHDAEMGRLHHHIESPRSILTVYSSDKHMHLIEQMIGMKCYLQEKVERDDRTLSQQIRYIESKEGTYRYSDHHFDAHSVFLALFRLPGDQLSTKLNIEEAFLRGVAREVSLSFSGDNPNFHAQNFKAHIRPQRSPL